MASYFLIRKKFIPYYAEEYKGGMNYDVFRKWKIYN